MMEWNPWLDAAIFWLPFAGAVVGWAVRAEKANRDCKQAYRAGYRKALAEMMKEQR